MTITALIPVSPIPSHPDTAILEQTLDSIRHHLPDAELIVTFDGVRPEHEHRRADYEEFIRRMLWRLDHHYGNTVPFIFDEHRHQSGMLRAVIDEIRTPLLLYVEQDTPLVTDLPIDWQACIVMVTEGRSNSVRFHHEAQIPVEHGYLMHGMEQPCFMRTSQWSQRPHLASTAFYRRVLEHFSLRSRCFIEDRMHGLVQQAYLLDGMGGWQQWRMHIYAPEGNIKRSYHLDGRAGESKYDSDQVF